MLKVKSFRQTTGYCGPASLKMVLEFFGVRRSEAALVKLSGATRPRGVEAAGLVRAAKKLGLKASVKNFATFEDIRKYLTRGIPVIVDWFSEDDGHYSVAVGLDRKYIYLQDPEWGRPRRIDRQTFQRVWFDFPGDFLRNKNDLIIRRLIVIWK